MPSTDNSTPSTLAGEGPGEGSRPLTPALSLKGRGGSDATPLMRQYHALKAQHPQELLLFHLGDFYELFGEDAQRAAPVLGIALTHRHDVPMCGMPIHASEGYIAKLLKAGLRVAIADQMDHPSSASKEGGLASTEEGSRGDPATKGLVKRVVVRVMTPGTLQEDALLQAKRSNFLACLLMDQERAAIAAFESSTGEFVVTETTIEPASKWKDEIKRLAPSEIILPTSGDMSILKEFFQKQGIAVTELPSVDFSTSVAEERLKQLYGTASLRSYGLEGKPLSLRAAGGLMRYMEITQCGRNFTIQPLRSYSLDDYLLMDAHTLSHLELQKESLSPTAPTTLLDVLDHTQTPMGARLLRRWLVAPLKTVAEIQNRLRKVEFFVENKETRRHLRAVLQGWTDTERCMSRLMGRSLLLPRVRTMAAPPVRGMHR